ncbi:hypothetical protein ANO11243_092300 [Dothideomycetidae sp. 11243]|nr:hypothetical protein ANO11243_092300 [fungal sp. No.11243]
MPSSMIQDASNERAARRLCLDAKTSGARASADGPARFVFVEAGSDAKAKRDVRSFVMREHFRRKKLANLKNSDRDRILRQALQPLAPKDKENQPELAVVNVKQPENPEPKVTHVGQFADLWLLGSPRQCIVYDHTIEHAKSLDPTSGYHFRRYFTLPNSVLDLPADVLTCRAYSLPLLSRFPLLLHCFTAFSSRYSTHQTAGVTSLYHHNMIIAIVNEQIARPASNNYHTILVGVQGAMASSFAAGNLDEFALHRRGQAQLLRKYGRPDDPDLVVYLVSNSLIFGEAPVNALFDPSSPSQCHDAADLTNLQMYADELVDILHGLLSRDESRVVMLERRSISQLQLFDRGSVLHRIVYEEPGTNAAASPCRAAFDVACLPFMIVYLTLLQIELDACSPRRQEQVYATILEKMREAKLKPAYGAGLVDWMLLVNFKNDTRRAWQATRLLHVLLRLSMPRRQHILQFLVWNLCLDTEMPYLDLAEVENLPLHVQTGAGGDHEELYLTLDAIG